MSKPVIEKEVAIQEIHNLLKARKPREYKKSPKTDAEIEQDYPDVIDAIMSGNLVFDDKYRATHTLYEPLIFDATNDSLNTKEVSFRWRIKPTQMANLGKGLSIEKDALNYLLNLLCFITDLTKKEVDELDETDYRVLSQLSTVFQ